MPGFLTKAFGYQGNPMALPVPDLDQAIPFYERVLGCRVVSRTEVPVRAAVLARDAVQFALAENGGDPTQDGVAFHVTGLRDLFVEFRANGLAKPADEAFDVETHGGNDFQVFYVVAPDGLCFWFGERQGS